MEKNSPILLEANRLHNLNCAVHWIHPNSKIPVKGGWAKDHKESWDSLVRSFKDDYGLGIRLGIPSKLKNGYLANIDIDIKSKDPKHFNEVINALDEYFPGLRAKAPTVKTGNGFRLFVKTSKPTASHKIAASAEMTKILLPGAPISRQQKQILSSKELAEGWRMRKAWEIEFMSVGKQVIVPPSIHPETGTFYKWTRPFSDENSLPEINPNEIANLNSAIKKDSEVWQVKDFTIADIDLKALNLENHIYMTVSEFRDLEQWGFDRSSALFSVCQSLVKFGLTDNEILNILTDPKNCISEVAYDHRNTTNRIEAMKWVKKYTLDKARETVSPENAFKEAPLVIPKLDKAASAAQKQALIKDFEVAKDWKSKLERVQKTGTIKPNVMRNIILILENEISPAIFRYNEFAQRLHLGLTPPWVGGFKKGDAIIDDMLSVMLGWFSEKYKIEPPPKVLKEAAIIIGYKNQYHPVKDYLNILPIWDGVPRLDSWLKNHFEAKGSDEYLSQVFTKWLVASVSRVFKPGTKFDWMPIFEGVQGGGKSSFGEILFGAEYFLDCIPNLEHKDSRLGLQGILCVEFSELSQMRNSKIEAVKSFITSRIDKVRPHYEKFDKEMPRQCVMFGTTNTDFYLKDATGNRRFNPVEVGRLNFKQLKKDKDQLWAEALFLYRNEFVDSLYLTGEAEVFAKEIQDDKRYETDGDIYFERLVSYLEDDTIKNKVDLTEFGVDDLMGCSFTGIELPFPDLTPDVHTRRALVSVLRKIAKVFPLSTLTKLSRKNNKRLWSLKFNSDKCELL